MAHCVFESSKVAKTLVLRRIAPSLHTNAKSLFCTKVTSTGEKTDAEKDKAARKEEGPERSEDGGYGDVQRKPGQAADSAHSHWEKAGSDSAHKESLADTGFDMSKRSKPSGDE